MAGAVTWEAIDERVILANMEGYIKLSRKFFDNKIWQAARAFSECEAWIDLIQSARFEASPTTSRIGCYEVTWGRGQYPASNRFLARKWGRSEQWVKSFLGKLKREKMITTSNNQGMNVITLVNFDKYNGNETRNPPNNPLNNPPNKLADSELREFVTHLVTHLVTHPPENQPTSNPNNKKDKENIKENSTIVESKKGAACAAAPIKARMESFKNSLVPFVGIYGRDMMNDFYSYWTEPNKSHTKMRFELERTWDVKRRLKTWAARDNNFNNISNGRVTINSGSTPESRAQECADIIARLAAEDGGG